MSNNIPNVRVPFFNIQQIINRARASGPHTSGDIIIPKYISDKRVISGIHFENIPYLKGITSLEPSYSTRYYYNQIITCQNPVMIHIYVSPWMGFAFQYRKTKVVDMLLLSNLDIYQKMVSIDYKKVRKDLTQIVITEGPCLLQVRHVLEGPNYEDFESLFDVFYKHKTNLERPLEVRTQILNDESIVTTEAACYRDIWDYLETRLRLLPPGLRQARLDVLKKVIDKPNLPPPPPIKPKRISKAKEAKPVEPEPITEQSVEPSEEVSEEPEKVDQPPTVTENNEQTQDDNQVPKTEISEQQTNQPVTEAEIDQVPIEALPENQAAEQEETVQPIEQAPEEIQPTEPTVDEVPTTEQANPETEQNE